MALVVIEEDGRSRELFTGAVRIDPPAESGYCHEGVLRVCPASAPSEL